MTTANTCGDMQRRVSAKGPPFVSAAIGGPDGNIKPGTLHITAETAGPDRDAEGSDRPSTRMAVALSSRGEMPETASAMRLTARARRNRHAPYSGTGQNRCKGDVFHDAFHERGARAAPSNSGIEAGLTLGAGVAANVRRPFPKILLLSRS
jgi:hypothetical protein